MKKKIALAAILLIVLAVLVVPIRTQFRDGGTTFYTALLFRVISWNALIDENETKTGTEVHFFPKNFRDYEYYFGPRAAVPEDTTAETTTAPVITAPDFDYMGLFKRLEGCWNDKGSLFVAFEYREGQPCLYYGIYDSGFGVNGQLTGGKITGEDKAELTFLCPQLGEDDEGGDYHPEMTVTVLLDLIGLDDGKINIKIESSYSEYGNLEWQTYTYSGKTVDEAYAKWSEFEIG